MIARQTAVQSAISFKGKREELCQLYNAKARPLPRGYKVKAEDLLCATYISCVFLALDWESIVPPECAAWRLYQNMDALDCGVQDPKRVPLPGDLIFFGNGKKVTNITHVGIVTEVKDNKQIYYYDIQSTVGRHTCPVGYSYIWGYGIPDYASKDLAPIPAPEPAPAPEPDAPHAFVPGDLVTVNPGARWYKGQSIKLSVINDKWYIMSVKGDRVVLGMNLAETRNIQSPIHDTDISLVVAAGVVTPPDEESITISVTIKKPTLEYLDILATGNNLTLGQAIDLAVEDYL